MNPWARFLPGRRIGTRLVAAVTLAMTVVLACAGAFVYWRVSYALDRQLDQDLAAYADITARQVRHGASLLTNSPGETAQVYTLTGTLVSRSDAGVPALASAERIASVTGTTRRTYDVGRMLPPSEGVYRVSVFRSPSPAGDVVVVAAISRRKHDEALRELLGQLLLTDVMTILAAGLVGYGVTRAALGPVERYRRAAAGARGGGPTPRLPVDRTRDDELTRLGHTFNQLLGEIEESNARERQFLADASHELRSPLALLAAEIEWARHRPRAPEELDEVLASVGTQVGRLVELSNTLLDLEELYSAHTAELAPVRVEDLVASALAGWPEQAAAQGRELRVAASADLVDVDARWLALAITNLVGNALKHGTGTVSVTAGLAGAAQDRLRLTVTDEGPGVPETLGTRAFDRFTRADESRSTRGNGLGLALVRAVAEAHGGTAALDHGFVVIDLPARASARP